MKLVPAHESNLDPRWVRLYSRFLVRAERNWNDHSIDNALNTFGVEASTIRAVRLGRTGKGGAPLTVYTNWASKQAKRILLDRPRWSKLNTRKGFDVWHAELAESLGEHWIAAVEARAKEKRCEFHPDTDGLSVAHLYKLVNLFVRYIRVEAEKYGATRLGTGVRDFGHIPLDRKSITTLQKSFGGKIPKFNGFSMGTIDSKDMYDHFQELARTICREAKCGSPLLFDMFALHSKDAQALYPLR